MKKIRNVIIAFYFGSWGAAGWITTALLTWLLQGSLSSGQVFLYGFAGGLAAGILVAAALVYIIRKKLQRFFRRYPAIGQIAKVFAAYAKRFDLP